MHQAGGSPADNGPGRDRGHARPPCLETTGSGVAPHLSGVERWTLDVLGLPGAGEPLLFPRFTPILSLLLLVPLTVGATPAEVEARLSLLEPVTVSRYAGDEGQGLKLAFKALGPDPALAQLNKNDTSASNGGPWTASPAPNSSRSEAPGRGPASNASVEPDRAVALRIHPGGPGAGRETLHTSWPAFALEAARLVHSRKRGPGRFTCRRLQVVCAPFIHPRL
jgi:hypothetical protein